MWRKEIPEYRKEKKAREGESERVQAIERWLERERNNAHNQEREREKGRQTEIQKDKHVDGESVKKRKKREKNIMKL